MCEGHCQDLQKELEQVKDQLRSTAELASQQEQTIQKMHGQLSTLQMYYQHVLQNTAELLSNLQKMLYIHMGKVD